MVGRAARKHRPGRARLVTVGSAAGWTARIGKRGIWMDGGVRTEGVMRMRSWQPALRVAIRDLNPGYFALVMATGIVSKAMRLDGALSLSGFLLAAAIAAYVLLAAAYAWRLAGYRREFLAYAGDPRRAFAFFTFAAGSDVLAARLAGDGHPVAAAALPAGRKSTR